MKKKLVIAITGPPGVGTSTIAKKVAKKLRLKYLSPGKTYKSYLPEKEAKAALDFWKTRFGSSKKLHEELDRDQIIAARKGSIVICGKLSIHFLKKLANYKIWLDALLKVRAERTAVRDKISLGEAKKLISEREKMERKNWKKLYGFDYFDQKGYADFILDNSNLTVNEAVNRILDFIKESSG